jgi:hypothetical protein
MAERALILLSCSRDKRSGGEPWLPTARTLASRNSVPKRHSGLLAARRRIFDLLQARNGRLFNHEQKGGYLDERIPNKKLRLGPDLGGAEAARYLPAWCRYNGRFFARLEEVSPGFWDELPRHQIDILFVSGLYGLVAWDELIQNYDCHFSDHLIDDGRLPTVARLWQNTLTEVLCDFINAEASKGRPFRCVFDLLSEEFYQGLFDWTSICGKAKVQVNHRAFRTLSGPRILPHLADILARDLRRFCSAEKRFHRDTWYSCRAASGSPVEFAFEYPLGTLAGAAREGDTSAAAASLQAELPGFRKLRADLRNDLIVAEHSWRMAVRVKTFDFGILVVAFARPVERWLKVALPQGAADEFGIVAAVQKYRQPLSADFASLWDLRNAGAHPDPKPVERHEAAFARSLALKILSHAS